MSEKQQQHQENPHAQLNRQTIQTLAQLSCISCSEEDEEKLLTDLQQILSYVEQLQELDTSQVAPCNTVLEGIVCAMREDIPEKPMDRKLLLDNAPQHTGGMIRVPSVIKK